MAHLINLDAAIEAIEQAIKHAKEHGFTMEAYRAVAILKQQPVVEQSPMPDDMQRIENWSYIIAEAVSTIQERNEYIARLARGERVK